MVHTLLITVRSKDTSHTCPYDGDMQPFLWIGPGGSCGPDEAYACLERSSNKLRLKANAATKVSAAGSRGGWVMATEVDEDRAGIYAVKKGEETLTLYVRSSTSGMRHFSLHACPNDAQITIGRSDGNVVRYQNPLVSLRHVRLDVRGTTLVLLDLQSANGTFVNGRRILPLQPRVLDPGDVVQILDLTMTAGKRLICINAPESLCIREGGGLPRFERLCPHGDARHEAGEHALFYPAPRLTKSIHPLRLVVEDPPARREPNRTPAIVQLGPSFAMGLTSVFMAMSSVSRMMGGADVLTYAPSAAMAAAMVAGSLIWPLVSRSYRRRQLAADERTRTQAYVSYLDGIENELVDEMHRQEEVINENRLSVTELFKRARELSPLLMNRTSVHEDFLELRVGVGDCAVQTDVTWPKRRLTIKNDPMLDKVGELQGNQPFLRDVPLAFNPARHFVTGVLGERRRVWEFVRGLVVQACAFYSYQDVKFVLIGNGHERGEWEFLTPLGHWYQADGHQRLVALTHAGMAEVDAMLVHELERREKTTAEVLGDFGAYYLVICANEELAERSEALRRILALRQNVGFSLVYLAQNLRDLPRECAYLIDLAPEGSTGVSGEIRKGREAQRPRSARMFERVDVSGTLVTFDPDVYVTASQARSFSLDLARIRLGVPGARASVPVSVGFLEVFRVGNVDHLNIGQRWAQNDASRSLQAQVGVDDQGAVAYLDLHENIHGPHGLIAGTTGSGKSEFIVSYVLSLCVNYAPDEVAFVLIDYKGGGLAGAFDNERFHLPHLAGVITNLDGGAIRRSLVSLKGELRRRQSLFLAARDCTGESTMDIYRYISFYRQGVLKDPLPHLFVIADEFAELKKQEPDFMNELVSAARIGRSLGIHLILATQKPTGVVDDQIWSNARFKVSLKVSDAADSREMIRRPDAAELTHPGQYYMLVGYNESFTAGQAAYAGKPYVPSSRFEPERDKAVELIDSEGRLIATQRPPVKRVGQETSELNAVLAQIQKTSQVVSKHARRLWLDPLPSRVLLDDLVHRYGKLSRGGLACIVGELDDPERQEQRRYEVDLEQEGNVMLFGSAASDVDGLLKCMLVSLAMTYGPDEVWLYAMDFGSSALSDLDVLPHTGGVVLAGDEERTHNLMRLLEREVAARREARPKHHLSPLPRIVVGIANLASFSERFEQLEERLVALTRDAPRYGMHFVVTTTAPNAPRMRLRTNFGLLLPTILNDPGDYSQILGNLNGMPTPRQPRRGLARMGKQILEFQGAYLGAEHDGEREWIRELACVGTEAHPCMAPTIPTLPRTVHASEMGELEPVSIPVGFCKESVVPLHFSLAKSPCMLVLGNDMDSIGLYLRGLFEALAQARNLDFYFIDSQHVLGEVKDPHVLQNVDEVCGFVRELSAGSVAPCYLILTSVVQTMNGLPDEERELLETFIVTEHHVEGHPIVAATELWRTKSLYQDWYKVLSAYGNGVWIGSGFAEQTVFGFSRSLPAYRELAARSDGFLVTRGMVRGVRLLEPRSSELKEGMPS